MSVFENVNQHCLEKIVSLAETHVITASEDIYDRNGVKLWAKGGKISPALRERLSAHKLRTPLELSLEVEKSLSTGDVFEDCQRLIATDPALISIAGSRPALATLSHLRMVKLPSALRLLLSAAHNKDEKAYRHLLYTIAICAGFATYSKMAVSDIEVLLASALLHDVGEIYINPEYLHANRPLVAKEWSAVAAHPKVGYLVSQEIGKLKEPIGLGIYQHHERLDGSGYPNMLGRDRISRVGAVVAAADATAAILLRGGDGAAYQAALAIRVIPEEFDADMRSFVCTSLRDLAVESGFDMQGLAQTKWVVEKLDRSDAAIAALLPNSSGKMRESLLMAKNVCDNVRKAIRAIGIDFLLQTVSTDDDGSLFGGEVSHVVRETGWRLRNLARNIQLRADMQPSPDQNALAALIELLESQPRKAAPSAAPATA